MPTTIPAMRGKFGSTEYYIVTMAAKEVADKLVIPKDLEDWEDRTIEERFQREVNFNRVKKHIAPYLAHDDDRFFGSLIVDIFNPEKIEFEPMGKLLGELPGLYQQAASAFGFLHLQGGEVLVPLDGQHRLAAMRFAITGKDEKGKDIPGLTPNLSCATDMVTLILVKHDDKKARKIFNKVNRYAKSTTKAENLITADDDIIAIITREEVADALVGERIVNYQSNTLNAKSECFTTLSTIYESTVIILEHLLNEKIDTTKLPDSSKQKIYKKTAKDYWEKILDNVDIFKKAITDQSEASDDKRREIRADFLLGKPIAQLAVIEAIMRLHRPEEDGSRISIENAAKKINKLDWTSSSALWQNVLMKGDKVVSGKAAAKFAGRFISYLLGEKLEKVEMSALLDQYKSNYPVAEQGKINLPKPVF